MGNTFGSFFRVTTFGESHCRSVGAVVDGCPPRIPLSEGDLQGQLNRRRPGQSDFTTPRSETDRVTIYSGVENGQTLGTPICMMVQNKDQRPGDYSEMDAIPRPSHADFTYMQKYGIKARSGGGRSSARETIGRVAAGALAEKILREKWGVDIVAWVSSVGEIEAPMPDLEAVNRSLVDTTPVRCPDSDTAAKMMQTIADLKDRKDSIGGTVSCICRNVPTGWGEPVFEKLEATLAHAMLSIPATKGFEIGSGFAGTRMQGSAHNDPFEAMEGRIVPASNNSGGVQGGISNGAPIIFKVAFKAPATIGMPQKTVDFGGNDVVLEAKGRHDPCVVPRAVVVVEAMAALALMDAGLAQVMISKW
jgi:chorismate synthase